MLKAGLDIDNDTQVVRCPPGRKVTSAEDLAINFRMGHPSKFAKKGGASASQVTFKTRFDFDSTAPFVTINFARPQPQRGRDWSGRPPKRRPLRRSSDATRATPYGKS